MILIRGGRVKDLPVFVTTPFVVRLTAPALKTVSRLAPSTA